MSNPDSPWNVHLSKRVTCFNIDIFIFINLFYSYIQKYISNYIKTVVYLLKKTKQFTKYCLTIQVDYRYMISIIKLFYYKFKTTEFLKLRRNCPQHCLFYKSYYISCPKTWLVQNVFMLCCNISVIISGNSI